MKDTIIITVVIIVFTLIIANKLDRIGKSQIEILKTQDFILNTQEYILKQLLKETE